MKSDPIIDSQYIRIVSSRLPNATYKRQSPHLLLNFKCVECGDSKKGNKKRGYIHYKTGTSVSAYYYHCHNCGYNQKFSYWLKSFDSNLYKSYLIDLFKDEKITKRFKPVPEVVVNKKETPSELKDLIKITDLPDNHEAKNYIKNRLIPFNKQFDIYHVDNYSKFINKLLPEEERITLMKYDPRIVFPLRDAYNKIFGFTARQYKVNSDNRYMINLIKEDSHKIFGLEHVNKKEDIFVVEGVIDSLFLKNSIAAMGLHFNIEYLTKELHLPLEKLVFVVDNEPRKIETVNALQRLVDNNLRVVIFPNYYRFKPFKEKDINNMKLKYQNIDFTSFLSSNTYQGMKARIKMKDWRKV